MAIDIGDAVLTFLGDTTQLEQAYDRVGTEAPAKMAPATAAIQGTSTAVDEMTQRMAVGANGAVELGEVTNLAGEKVRESMYEARGELGLLGEMFGIHLPRHVRSFVAELPGVGVALSAAFSATAVLFLIEALVQGIEKVVEWAHSAQKIQEAWDEVDKTQRQVFETFNNGVLKAQAHAAELSGNHLEALRLKLQLIDNITLAKLDSELEKLGKTADAAFEKMDRNWVFKLVEGLDGAEKAKDKFDELQKATSKAFDERTPEAYASALKLLDTAAAEATKKLGDLAEQQKKFDDSRKANANDPLGDMLGASKPDPGAVKAWQELRTLIQDYTKDVQRAKDESNEQKKAANDEEAAKIASEQAAASKRALDEQIAKIEQWKANVHEAYASGKTDAADWQVAELKAADASAIAHEQYLQRIIGIYSKSGQTLKAQAAQQELSTLQIKDASKAIDTLAVSEEKHRQVAAKITGEYLKMVEVGIDKDFAATEKATQDLSRANEQLLKTQTALDVENSAKRYHDQEEAIKQLASMQLITEQQKNTKLIQLYNQQEAAALKSLQDQLTKEKAIIDAAQVKVKSAEGNPFFTDAQVLELRKNLALAEVAYLKTQDQISKTEDKFEKERLAVQKGAVGQAIALATAAGNQQLALDLKQHQSALISIKDQIALSKARHEDVSAMKQQEKEIEKQTQDLVKQASQISKLKQAWDIFSNDFSKRAKTDETVAQQMAQTFQTAAQGMEQGIQGAFAAMVSGTESAGEAMEKVAFKTIGSMAQQWAAYYGALAIADLMTPGAQAKGAAELAASIALEALAGVMSGLGSATSGSKSSGGAASNSSTITQNASTKPGGQTTTLVNVPKLGGGGLVQHQTLALVGDDEGGGGNQEELILPLGDSRAKQAIMEMFGGSSGGATHNHYYLNGIQFTTHDMTMLSRRLTRAAQTGRARVSVANAARVTRKG